MLYLGGEKVFMLGLVVIYWAIWKARIKLALRKKTIKDPIEVFCSAYTFICYWAGLYPGDTRNFINAGVEIMMRTMIKILGRRHSLQHR
jgi:hypothetical protein